MSACVQARGGVWGRSHPSPSLSSPTHSASTTQDVAPASLVCPAGHPMQDTAPPVLYWPGAHSLHEVSPGISLNSPGAHGWQSSLLPGTAPNCPAEHGVHPAPTSPTSHALHSAASAPLVWPGGHSVHADAPASLNCPGAHTPVHASAPCAPYRPAAQSSHADAPAVSLNCPAGHASQLVPPSPHWPAGHGHPTPPCPSPQPEHEMVKNKLCALQDSEGSDASSGGRDQLRWARPVVVVLCKSTRVHLWQRRLHSSQQRWFDM